jgi:CheY-like chemotaxis protein
VTIYSEPGEGTTIKLNLPRFFAEEKEESEVEALAGSEAAGETILVVEDDDEVRAYVVEVLCGLNYRVFDARDAGGALDIFAKHGDEIDILLTDVTVPGKNGRQIADEIVARQSNIKVLYMTGYSRNAIVHQGRLNPGVEVIQKPLTQESLAVKIRETLERGG